MHILLINHYAGSIRHGMEYRPYYLSQEWIKMGHEVTIVAASYSHVRTIQPRAEERAYGETIDGLRYIWLPTPPYSVNGGKRALNMFSFIWQLLRHKSYILGNTAFDLVVASSTYPLDIWPAHRIAKKISAKLIFEVHDLWPLSPMELGGMSKYHPFIMLLQQAEDYACRQSDWVVSMLPKADEHLRTRGMSQEKFVHIPNGIKVDMWQEDMSCVSKNVQSLLNKLKRLGHFTVGYAGGHGIANALDSLVETASIVKKQKVSIVLIGDGNEKNSLMRKAKELTANNIYFVNIVKKTAIPSILAQFDSLYLGWQRAPLYRFGISPNKLMDYMMAAKPVIHAVDAGNDLVAESGCGISVPPENPNAIAEAIIKLKSMPSEERIAMGIKGKEYVLAHHDYKVLAHKFLEIMSEPL